MATRDAIRDVCVSKSAVVHLVKREDPPRSYAPGLVVTTYCGVIAFEAEFDDSLPRCLACSFAVEDE
jgi:hypothetical protein